MKKSKLKLVNYDLLGNQTIIRAKYDFIIKILNWLGNKEYITIDYVSAPTTKELESKHSDLIDAMKYSLSMRPPLKNNSKKKIKPLSKKLPIKKTK